MDRPGLKQDRQRDVLRRMFDAAVNAALPANCVAANLPPKPSGRTIVIGAGKASAAMAQAFEANWHGPLEGLVVTRYGHGVPCKSIEIVEASHPVPDAKGQETALRMLQMVRGLTTNDLVVALMSGGGSALLSLPPEGVSFEEKQALNRSMLASGAPIVAMNCLRKHVSRIKGGRLAVAACPAKLVTLAISDIPGDDLAAIASGPTLADATTFADARNVVSKYQLDLPSSILHHLAAANDESPKPGDPRLAGGTAICIASPMQSLESVSLVAKQSGYDPRILGDAMEGEARDVAKSMAELVRKAKLENKPLALISGGETTVTLRGNGIGGRNVEFLLALAIELDGLPGVYAMAADSDGIDGAADVAGAFISPDTLSQARKKNLNPAQFLTNNDAHTFFSCLCDQLITGPTLTNVNDIRIILVDPMKR
jgi:glycerate 2-kinase